MPQTVQLSISLNTAMLDPSDYPALLQAFGDNSPVFEDVVEPFLESEETQAYQTHGASIGQPWAASDPRWSAWKYVHGFSTETLHMTNRLAQSIGQSVEYGDDSVTVGTDVPYAAKLQSGFSGRAPDGIYRNVPGRVYMDVPADQAADLAGRIAEFIAERAGVPAAAILVTVE